MIWQKEKYEMNSHDRVVNSGVLTYSIVAPVYVADS